MQNLGFFLRFFENRAPGTYDHWSSINAVQQNLPPFLQVS